MLVKFKAFLAKYPRAWLVVQILCLIWVILSFSSTHLLHLNGNIYTNSASPERKLIRERNTEINKEWKAFRSHYKHVSKDSKHTEMIFINKHFDKSYLCVKTGYFGMTYKCTNKILEIITGYPLSIFAYFIAGFLTFKLYFCVFALLIALPIFISIIFIINMIFQGRKNDK